MSAALTMLGIATQAVALATAAAKEDRAITRKVFKDPNEHVRLDDPRFREVAAHARPHEDALAKFLESLTVEQVYKLQTIMYVGRGDMVEGSFRDLHRELLKVTPDKTDAIETITSKLPAGDYMAKGLQVAQTTMVDLDAPWG